MQKNINVVAEVKDLLTEYVSEGGMYISSYNSLIVTGQVTIGRSLDINFSYDSTTGNAKIRTMYYTKKYEIDVHIIGDERNCTDFSVFCDTLVNIIVLYKKKDKKEFIKFLLDL